VGKEVKITSQGDVYGRSWDVEKYEAVLFDMLEREYHKNMIYLAIKQGCTNVRTLSEKTGLEILRISYLLADMERISMVEFTGMEDSKPVFAAL
jgi:predicted transcriptional regulator